MPGGLDVGMNIRWMKSGGAMVLVGATQPTGSNMAIEKAAAMNESEFRALAAITYRRVLTGFDEIDPDLAEAEESQGSLTITLADGARWILSLQPPVRQIWLAVASLGRAYHFDYDPAKEAWCDDKGEGKELLPHLAALLAEVAQVEVRF